MTTAFDEVKLLNKTQMIYLQSIGRNNKINCIIDEVLKDEACFFKMDKSVAIRLLQNLNLSKERIDELYTELISKDLFMDLYNKKIIDINDNKLVIKYEIPNW